MTVLLTESFNSFIHWMLIHSAKLLTVFLNEILNYLLNWFGLQCLLLCSVRDKRVDYSYEWDTESSTKSVCSAMLIQLWAKQLSVFKSEILNHSLIQLVQQCWFIQEQNKYEWVTEPLIQSIHLKNADSFRNKKQLSVYEILSHSLNSFKNTDSFSNKTNMILSLILSVKYLLY